MQANALRIISRSLLRPVGNPDISCPLDLIFHIAAVVEYLAPIRGPEHDGDSIDSANERGPLAEQIAADIANVCFIHLAKRFGAHLKGDSLEGTSFKVRRVRPRCIAQGRELHFWR